mmetsp:Transcript_2532/g.5649  ORF Transcript_2532/g.5649 Transcript_2532/m.5649 type:complete len:161 (+) Transcript_2532:66-548(+)
MLSARDVAFLAGGIGCGFLLSLLSGDTISALFYSNGCSRTSNSNQDFRLYLVVRRDLKMGSGKIAAQCAHAAVGAYKANKGSSMLLKWELQGAPKIVVEVADESELLHVQKQADALGLPTFMNVDRGRTTQIAPCTRTVLALGPATAELLNPVTSTLRLL